MTNINSNDNDQTAKTLEALRYLISAIEGGHKVASFTFSTELGEPLYTTVQSGPVFSKQVTLKIELEPMPKSQPTSPQPGR